MSVRNPLHRRGMLTAFGVLVLAIAAGGAYLFGVPSDVPPVCAACGSDPNCTPPDGTVTSALAVTHVEQDGMNLVPVEPDTGETWSITATWSTDFGEPPGCDCENGPTATVTAQVDWTDSTGWSVSCTGCSQQGWIRSVSVCNAASCGGVSDLDNGWGYKLLLDIAYPRSWTCPPMETHTTPTSPPSRT